jgi:hypothetical protein
METTPMNYQDFVNTILNKSSHIKNTLETHFTAVRFIEIVKKNSHLTTVENVNKFFEVNVRVLADEIFNQTVGLLKFNKKHLSEKPDTNDFPSRYEAYKFTFKTFVELPISDDAKSYLLELESKINEMYLRNKSGCYIATMAYGDYDHHQVKTLRGFRDDVLDKNIFGKYFIKIYYKYSPKLVEKLKDNKPINTIIRKGLNQIIKIIK